MGEGEGLEDVAVADGREVGLEGVLGLGSKREGRELRGLYKKCPGGVGDSSLQKNQNKKANLPSYYS